MSDNAMGILKTKAYIVMKNKNGNRGTHPASGGKKQQRFGQNQNPRVWKNEQSTAPQARGHAKDAQHEIHDMRDLLIYELRTMLAAEQAMAHAFPDFIHSASSYQLADVIAGHLGSTKQHVAKLESIFTAVRSNAVAGHNEAIAGMVVEAQHVIAAFPEGAARDAAIIVMVQKMEHYEIAAYGSLIGIADALGETEAAKLLYEILTEEKKVDEKLTLMAETINQEAIGQK
jgi:ferritin-like metal-binding protein YciE